MHIQIFHYLSDYPFLKLIIAAFLGSIIGFERDVHGRAAGLRTHFLVSLGAALFMILSELIALHYANMSNSVLRIDPERIAAQVVTGIGFLGAGVIIKSGLTVRGLTTAASLWLTASIGMSVGAGYLELGITTTLIGLFALIILNKFENLYTKEVYRILEIYTNKEVKDEDLLSLIERKGVKIIYFDKEIDYKTDEIRNTFTLKIRHKDTIDKLSNKIISDLDNSNIKLHKIKWTHR